MIARFICEHGKPDLYWTFTVKMLNAHDTLDNVAKSDNSEM